MPLLNQLLNKQSLSFTAVIATAMILGGCGAASSSDDPELNDFGIIDTGGSNSSDTAESDLLVDADENDPANNTDEGEFTLYWEVDTNDDYTLDVYINDRDSRSGALTLLSDFCDPDDDCHDQPNLECEFQNDLDLICEDYDGDEREVDISRLVDSDDLPEDLFFIVQVCDAFGFDCEDRSLEVRFDD